jgi:hypothetical protein
VRCARVFVWLQKSARGVGLREANLVAAGVGDGGLVTARGTDRWRMDVESVVRRQRPARRRARGGLLAGGRRSGSRKPPAFTGVVVEAVFGSLARSVPCIDPWWATGASESRRSPSRRWSIATSIAETAGRSESGNVNRPPPSRVERGEPNQARVLVFEMWIAEVGQTHLWLVRGRVFGPCGGSV